MQTLAKFIAQRTPRFNKQLVEGLVYHRINKAVNYIDNFIKYSCNSKTNTHLKYLGFKEVPPKEEIKFLFNKTSKVVHDIAENDLYLVKFMFQYGEEEQVREHYFYLPYLSKGNIIHLSGNKFLVMPVLSDKVVSVGDKIIFINILTAKYSFTRAEQEFTWRTGELFTAVAAGTIEVTISHRYRLADSAQAHRDLQGRKTIGSVVLIP